MNFISFFSVLFLDVFIYPSLAKIVEVQLFKEKKGMAVGVPNAACAILSFTGPFFELVIAMFVKNAVLW